MIGIDLGTTKSCVAVMEGGVPQVIPNQEEARTTPSVVAFTANGEVLVGEVAKQHASVNPKHTVSAVTRLIGRKFDSPQVEQARRFLPYQLVEAPNGDAHIQIEDKVYSPEEICNFVLHKLKAAAEDYLGEAVQEAVVSVPAYFNDPQCQATKNAGQIAGLKVSRIIRAPTAAALTYGLKNIGGNTGQFVAVYDLGGGTFDITILEMAEGLFQVRATGGDTYLGGEDFDQRIINWLIAEFHRETGIHLKQDRRALQRLKELAERAKCELSTARQTEIDLPFISADGSGPKHLKTVLSRQRYEELTDDLLGRTIEPCKRCLSDAGLKPEQIDEVLLVGGQTRAPKVLEVVRKIFGKEPNRTLNPDEAVAMGAAIQTGIMVGKVKDIVLLDVTPHTLGIETEGGTFTPLIERNSTIPTRKSRVFTTVADNQTRVEVHVLQGESDTAAYNRSLARFELTNIPPAPASIPTIEVTFEIDVNGVYTVSAQDQATGRSQSMVIGPSALRRPALIQTKPPEGEATGLVLLPVLPHTLGVEAPDGSFAPIIGRNTRIPTRASHLISTTADNQARMEVHVLQGESAWAAYNKSLARFEITNIPPAPRGVPQIEVTFEIDANGIVSVGARDQATGRSHPMLIHPSDGLSQWEVNGPAAEAAVPKAPLAPEAEPASFLSEAEAVVHYLTEEERQQTEKVSTVQKIYRLNTAEKLITALKGTREERAILIRDPDPRVASAVLDSPWLTDAEIESFCAMKNVSDHVLRQIGHHREWAKRYAVVADLVRNPRTPLAISLRLVSNLNPRDMKSISTDGDVPEAVREAVQKSVKPPAPREDKEKTHTDEAAVLRQLDRLIADTMRSVQALEGKLTPDEQQGILAAIERAKEARNTGTLEELRTALTEMEKAATITGQAMLRR
jgi:molecular chaperone DnaK